jgi:hypothetical protein
LWATLALIVVTLPLRADQLQMQNGDRYTGKVVSVTEDSVVLQSDVLGKVTLPRNKIQTLNFGDAKAADPTLTASTTSSAPVNSPNAATTNADLAAAFRRLGANTNFVQQVRQQMLTGSPQAAQKYDELVTGMMSGKLNLNDLRSQAKTSIDQINQLKRELGPEAGDALDDYLTILQNFVDESTPARTPVKPVTAPSTNSPPVAVTGAQPAFRDTITK